MSENLIVAVGKCIRTFRSEANYTQEDLADLSNLDRSYISGVERGVRNVTLQSLEHIVKALGVDLPTFFKKLTAEINDLPNK